MGSKVNLNTSHVEVYLYRTACENHRKKYLNTSHVEVYPLEMGHVSESLVNLNTSHVEVYHSFAFIFIPPLHI